MELIKVKFFDENAISQYATFFPPQFFGLYFFVLVHKNLQSRKQKAKINYIVTASP